MRNPGQEPTLEGNTICPAVEGATNWFSTSFNPATGLYYVQTLEKCTVYTKEPGEWQAGQSYYGGNAKETPDDPAQKILRAIDVKTGAIAWELPQTGPPAPGAAPSPPPPAWSSSNSPAHASVRRRSEARVNVMRARSAVRGRFGRPTAAQSLVDGNEGDGGGLLAADELVFRGVDRAPSAAGHGTKVRAPRSTSGRASEANGSRLER